MILTREEAIRIHRDMWRYLKEHGAGKETIERKELKHNYCRAHGYNFKYNCVLCEYADSYGGCCACPAIWGSEDEKQGFSVKVVRRVWKRGILIGAIQTLTILSILE